MIHSHAEGLTPERTWNGPRAGVFLCAAVLAGCLGYGLLHMPLQVFDGVDEIILVQKAPTVWAAFTSTIGESAYFRPLRFAQDKILMDLAPGHYFAAFKTFHIALVIAAFALFVGALPIRTTTDMAAAIFALSVFAGLHTFLGMVKEAYPINHFLEILVLALVAMHLARSRGGWLTDTAAIATFLVASLTLESGILIWVVLVTSRLLGRRGVSNAGLAILTALLAAYLLARFAWLSPNLQKMGNASGYFFERLERSQAIERFGHGLTRFNVYNVLVSMMTVLFSEPRAGVFVFFRAWSAGDIPPRMWINVISSAVTTSLLGIAAWRRWSGEQPADAGNATFVLFAAVLVASAITSYAYAKDEIVSVSGAFYALAVFWAVRDLLSRRHGTLATTALAVALLVAGSGWAVRTIGLNHVLRVQAFDVHNDWAGIPEQMQRRGTWPADPDSRQLLLDLRDQSLRMPIVNPWFIPRWADRVFDLDYY